MGFLKRMLGGDEAPGPDWARPMSSDEAAAFIESVGQDIERRGLRFTIGEGVIRVEIDGQDNELGLSNLAQVCHGVNRGRWPTVIGEHFDNLFSSIRAEAEFQTEARDLDRVRQLLKVRLFPGSSLGGMEPRAPVSWEPAPAMTAAFVFDLPTTVRSVGAEHIASWGLAHDALLEIALANVRGDAVEARPIADEGPSAPIACVADHFFVASHALLLGERLPAQAADGAVFAVPHRHALLYAPIVDMGIVPAVNRLILTAVSLFQEGPGSISPGLYWWRGGEIRLLPAAVEGGRVSFSPPEEFVSVLNRLAESGGTPSASSASS